RQSAAAVRLTDGRVLVAGGIGASPFASLATAELYDPANGTWAATGSMRNRRYWTFEDMAALDNFLSLLPDGRVFTAGGVDRAGGRSPTGLSAAEIYALNTTLARVAVAGPPVTGTEGAAVAFGGSGSADPDGAALSYLWDFGDGSPTATGAQVSHVYADNGTYT